MSIKLYWGSNGSYKSASAVQYDIIPELLKGRVVVTNIRGCTLEKCIEQYPDIPDSADVLYVDTEKAGAYEKMRTWYRWAPHGALIVIDEIQLFFHKSLRQRDFDEYILEIDGVKATEEQAEAMGQPYSVLEAYTKHRHFNWDIVLTTPNIKMVHSEIRETTEVAYRQANGALLGFKGKFKRSMHDADENKPNANSLTQTLSINKKTFKCYQSTKTGVVQDTRAGTNIFKSPRLLLALACSIGAICYSFASGGYDYLLNGPSEQVENLGDEVVQVSGQVAGESVELASEKGSAEIVNDISRYVPSESVDNVDSGLIATDVFSDYDASITYYEGFTSGRAFYFLIEFDKWKENGQAFSMSSGELLKIGYRFKLLTECALVLYYGDTSRLVTCWRPNQSNSKVETDSDDFNPVAQAQ